MDEHIDESQSIDKPTEQQPARDIPKITIDDTDQDRTTKDEPSSSSSSSTETEMSSSHRSSHHSSSKSKHSSSSSKSKSKKDDWSEITDPEERRRVQNRIAQRKFRDKAKEAKERQERDANDRAHAGHSYHTPDPSEMGPDEELSGLPWGGMSIKHVVSKGRAREEESRRGSRTNEDRGSYDSHTPLYDDRDVYYEGDAPYEDADQAYYDYGSGGSGHGGSSR